MHTEDIWHVLQAAAAVIGGWVGWYIGEFNGLVYALLAVMAVDYLTGVLCAIEARRLSSSVGFKGLARKLLIFALVGLGHIMDRHVIGTGSVLRTAIIMFYLANEALSIIENAARLGLPVPERLKLVLAQLHDNADGKTEDEK